MITDWSLVIGPMQALILALFGLAAWRIQLIAQRRFTVAEDAIVAFSLARSALESARNGLSFAGEGATLKAKDGDSEQTTERKRTFYVPIERLERQQARFAELERVMLLARHHLGEDAYEAFETLIRARNAVMISAGALIRRVGEEQGEWGRSEAGLKFYREREEDIWEIANPDGKLNKDIATATSTLRAICDREARATAALWPFRTGRRSKRAGKPMASNSQQ